MKNILPALAMILLLACGLAQADNNIMIMADTVTQIFDLPVGFENESALQGLSNGFRLSATGNVIALFLPGEAYLDTLSRGGLVPQVIGWNFRYTQPPDSVLIGGVYL